jgi:membrane peptidoglycan carboxypeptidase
MKITTKIETKRIKDFFRRFSRFIGERFFLSFLFSVILALIVGGFVFYQYVFLVESIELNISETPVFFDEDIYKKVLEKWQNREREFQEIESKQYSNPFLPPAPGA